MFFKIIFNILYCFELLFSDNNKKKGDKLLKRIDLLTSRNDILAKENGNLIQQYNLVKQEYDTFKELNDTVRGGNDTITQQYTTIKEENDAFKKLVDLVRSENETLIQQYNLIKQENDTFKKLSELVRGENETLMKQHDTLREQYNTLIQKYDAIIQQCDTLIQQNDILTQEKNSFTTTNLFNNKVLFKLVDLYLGYTEIIDLSNSTEITVTNPKGNTIYKYSNDYNINLSNIKLNDVLLNDNNIDFLGFIGNDNYIYIIIPNIVNDNNINILQIGNENSIQIIHNFIPIITSINYLIKTDNTDNTFNIIINGNNLFSFSKVIMRLFNNVYISDIINITDFITNDDYTRISSGNIINIYSQYPQYNISQQYIIEIYNYNTLQSSHVFSMIHNSNTLLNNAIN